jgi:hypothetical protein
MIQPEDIIVEGDDLSVFQSQIAVSKIHHTPQRSIPVNLCYHISPENPYPPRKRSPALKDVSEQSG